MNKILTKIICTIFGHIYPSKKMELPKFIKDIAPDIKVFMADTSKPCHRCGTIKEK